MSPPGSPEFLGCLQKATTKLWNALSDEDQESFINLSQKWSDEAPPHHIQARYAIHIFVVLVYYRYANRMASSVGAKITRDFQTQLFQRCGIRSIVLTAHQHEDGQIMTSLYVVQLFYFYFQIHLRKLQCRS
jgi:hypothetical protein